MTNKDQMRIANRSYNVVSVTLNSLFGHFKNAIFKFSQYNISDSRLVGHAKYEDFSTNRKGKRDVLL
jgi:hypothetical protein